jgi:hypothetical protein
VPSTRCTLYLDDTYGVILRSIENVDDGAVVTFANGPLFRLVVRDSFSGALLTCEPSPVSQVAWSTGGDPEAITDDPGFGAPDGLGPRSGVTQIFSFGPFPDGRYLLVRWVVAILESHNLRARFSLFCFWSDASDWAILWQAPTLLQLDPLPRDQYVIGVNGGVATQDPQHDLFGNGDDFQFAAASRFEPELNVTHVDRMEAAYPGPVGVELSAYGTRSTGETVMMHGDLSGRAARFRDYYDQTSILLEQQVLAQDALTANNNGQQYAVVTQTTLEAHRYVRVFRATGEVLGEEAGIEWRRWLLSSVEGKALLTARARDRTDMARYTRFPLWLQFGNEDTERETEATADVADEYRELIGTPWSDSLPRHCPAVLDPMEQDTSAKRPANVNDAIPSLFDLQNDDAKGDWTTSLRTLKSMFTTSSITPRRPAPYDGGNYWDSYDGAGAKMDLLRVKDSFERALGGAYKTTDQWLQTVSQVAAFFFDGTYTWIRPIASFDKTHFARQTTYAKGGHAAHPQHLGFLVFIHAATPHLYPIEAVNQAQFNLNYVAVAGDVTAQLAALDVITLYWVSGHYLPGADRLLTGAISETAATSLCGFADDYGAGVDPPTVGPFFLLGEKIEADFSEFGGVDSGAGLVLERTQENPVCWNEAHSYPHAMGGNQQFVGWRRVLQGLRARLAASNGGQWMQFDDGGPIDYLLGQLDGSSATFRRLALTTSPGSWGMSPLFVTALGDFVRTGFYENGGHGHLDKGLVTNDFAREALLADWMHGRKLLTLGHVAAASGVTGRRRDGEDAYSPLNEETHGIRDLTSPASLIARLLQVQQTFQHGNFHGQRMRSLQRLSTGSDPSAISDPSFEGHDLGSHETGTQRPYLMHCVFADPSNRRRLIAVIANPSASTRGDSFAFLPAWYRSLIPGRAGAYKVTKYSFNPTVVAPTVLGFGTGSFEISEKLDPGEVVAYVFEFVSGLRFQFRFDDNSFEELDVAYQQTRARVGPITGQGARFQYAFADDQPDEDVKIASMDMRVFLLGQSENK